MDFQPLVEALAKGDAPAVVALVLIIVVLLGVLIWFAKALVDTARTSSTAIVAIEKMRVTLDAGVSAQLASTNTNAKLALSVDTMAARSAEVVQSLNELAAAVRPVRRRRK